MDAVKAQIRHEFIAGISIKKPDSSKYSSLFDFRERAICSIVFHFLKRRSLTNSLSVYVAECGLSDKSSVLSEIDLLETLKFNAVRNSYKVLHNLEGSNQKLLLENLLTNSFKEKKRDTLLDLLLHFSLSINEEKSKEMETQTQITGPGVRESLDLHLSQLRCFSFYHVYLFFCIEYFLLCEMFLFKGFLCAKRFGRESQSSEIDRRKDDIISTRL